MKRLWGFILVGSLGIAQRCPEPVYVVTTVELRWTVGGNASSIAAGKTVAACEGDTLEAVKDGQISYGYAAGTPQKQNLKAGQRFSLQLPKGPPKVVKGIAATLSDNLKTMAQRWFGNANASPVQAASRDPQMAKRNVYMPLLALGNNRILTTQRLVLPYAEAQEPYTLSLSQGGQEIIKSSSPVYHLRFVLGFSQPLKPGIYQIRLESGNGSVLVDNLEVVDTAPIPPEEISQSEAKTPLGVLWLTHQPGWALQAYQQAYALQQDEPTLGVLLTLLSPQNLEEEQLLNQYLMP